MLPGPTIVKKCSECSKLIREPTILSGNTFGAVFWTDGKREAPMLPDHPWLVKCPHCQTLIWIDELEIMEEIEPFEFDNEARGLAPMEPSLEEYHDFLQQETLGAEKERYVRLRAWWAGNDLRRASGENHPLSESERGNLESFAEILDQSDGGDRIMTVEIRRELGQYDKALALLTEPFDDELTEAVGIIKDLVEKQDPYVARMLFD